ncbi:MAG: long-chain fatty acid--CoA ligase [Magnetospirillum sp.]|nr:long-chain fatty acid--CoA ligase [Magnetospirillum sp.]
MEYGDSPLPLRPVHALVDEAAARHGKRPAIDFLGKRYSYARLAALVARAARGFQFLGVRKGVRVGLCLPNCPYFVISYYAVLKAGGTVVNFNPLYAEPELRRQIDDSGTVLMVTLDLKPIYPKVAAMLDTSALERVVICSMAAILPPGKSLLFAALRRSEMADIPADLRHIPFARLIANDGSVREVAIDPARDLAVLQYTGGTTGEPKGAMLTHANLTANTEQTRRWVPGIRPGQERIVGVLPLFHVFAMTVVMNLGVAVGAELILLPRFAIRELMRVVARKRPTMLPGVPTLYAAVNAALDGGGNDVSTLRYCICGGAPLPLEMRSRFERLTGCRLVEGYGLSETSPVATINPIDGPARDGSVGKPVAGTVVEVRERDNPARVLGPYEHGEICIRGPQVMAGYWQRPADTAAAFADGALRTGDVGYVDGDGFVFLVDRIKDVILCGGFNVYPRVVEEALYRHPAVAEAVVIGIPDPYRGQSPKAFVRLKDGARADAEDLRRHLAGEISRIEMPGDIEIRAELPKTAVGKLTRAELLAEELAKAAAAPPHSPIPSALETRR